MAKMPVAALAHDQPAHARRARNGRSTRTMYGHQHLLPQTLIKHTAGQRRAEQKNPDEATVQVLHALVRLTTGVDAWESRPGI